MSHKNSFLLNCWLIALLTISFSVHAEEDQWELGFRLNVEVADGKPANDILGYGIYGLYPIDKNWSVGFGLDLAAYDFERPARLLGISSASPKAIDADTTSTMISSWAERYYDDFFETSTLYWKLGIGINSIDVDNATGPVSGGGTFNIQTDAGTDAVLLTGVGIKRSFGENWNFDSVLGYNQHFGKWTLRDLNSSATTTVDGFSSFIIQLGLTKEF